MVDTPRSELYRTIRRQPDVLRESLLRSRPLAREAAERLVRCRRILLTGTGTSHHAAQVGAYLLREAGVEATARSAFDFVHYPTPLGPEDGVVVISHRGSKRYGSAAIPLAARAGAVVVGVTGQGSPMAGPTVIIPTAPPEISSTHTMSYTANLAAIAQVAVDLGDRRGHARPALAAAVAGLPDAVERALAREADVVPAAEALARSGRLVLMGAGPNAATAREGALKVKESSYLSAEGFELEDFLHGGLQPTRPGDLAVPIVPSGPSVERSRALLRALDLVGALPWPVVDEAVPELRAEPIAGALPPFRCPTVPEPLSPILAAVPLQLLAAYTAEIRGTNADSFREDDPVFARALASYPL
jgi:glucosamine--fructose-6-phosphate aminotransferase (isomerizing)